MWSWNGRDSHSTGREICVRGRPIQPTEAYGECQAGRKEKNTHGPEDSQRTEPIYHLSRCQTEFTVGEKDLVPYPDEPPLNVETEDEGLKVFVQTGKCRRQIWGKSTATKRLVRLIPSCESDQALTVN